MNNSRFTLLPVCILIILFGFVFSEQALAQDLSLDAFKLTTGSNGAQTYSLSIKFLVLMTALTFLPALVLMMSSFTRIVIVLSILRQALGMPQTPSNQIIIGISLFLSFFIMSPTIDKVYTEAIIPYQENKINDDVFLEKVSTPLKSFMLNQVREDDLHLFLQLSKQSTVKELVIDFENEESLKKIPMNIIVPAFVTSELKTAFQIGFVVFVPFLIIDLVVSSVLMSMGMMMLSPLVISLPFKIMLFVLVDGWNLIIKQLAISFS
jgi:flagellar biosynthetic protein FliP